MTPPGKPLRSNGYLHGLDTLRMVASVLVVYTHVANWFATRGHIWWGSAWIDRDVIGPLHLNPALSFAGVATFLVVSGLVVTHVANRETPGQFLRRRLTRIGPLLLATTVSAWCLINLGVLGAVSKQKSLDVGDLLLGTTMTGYFTTPEVVLNGVTWTLLVQVVFYLFVAATIPLLRSRAWLPPALAAAVVCVGLSFATAVHHNIPVHRVGIIAAFLPVLCIGQLISLVRNRHVSAPVGIAVGAANFMLFVWAGKLGEYFHTGTSHPRTLLLVIGVVILAMTAGGRISRSAVVRGWSARTYAIYLLHPLCIYPLMDWMVPDLGPDVSLVTALAVLAAVNEVFHRYLEMPVNQWIRAREKTRTRPSGRV